MVRFRVVGVLVLIGCCAALACDRHAKESGADSSSSASPSPSPSLVNATPTATALSLCTEICDHVRPLHCSEESRCLSQCQEMSSVAVCHPEMLTVLGCMAREPASNFECDQEEGAAALREGICSTEQARFAACYDARAPAPP